MNGVDRNVPPRDGAGDRAGDAGLDPALEQCASDVDAGYRALLDATPAMIWVSGPDKGGTYFNQAWREFTGRSLDQELGAGWMEAVHPDDGAALDVCARAFAHQRSFSTELRLRRRDGAYCWVLDRGVPRFDERGEFQGYVGCAVDISEHKQTEEALADADRDKGELIAVLAHELRSPLAAIRCALDLELEVDDLDPRAARTREIIGRQTRQMTRLIDDLLDTARIARGRMELAMDVVDLSSLLAGLSDDHRVIAESRGLELVRRVSNAPIFVRGDAGRLGQAIGNLLDNAIKFTDAPGTVEVIAGRVHASSMIFVSVRDTGIGIEPESLATLFAPGAIRRCARSGLGLGLSIVRDLAELHGGSVDAASAGRGHGTTFTLWLPPAA